jgi:hypothetical protein
MSNFTPESLVLAVTRLFELNNYKVAGPRSINGAEVDLIAAPIADPFGRSVYIEVTIEYVDNNKYGKDVGKLAMIGEIDRDAQRLIVSSSGFSLRIRERAEATRIKTLTYDELFRKFERFEPYISAHDPNTDAGRDVAQLAAVYEPPQFDDALGEDYALDYLTEWKNSENPEQRWIVITGEYGTGKTALTRVLHHRWLEDYKTNPILPIPFRIELRSFVRQFDARGLLHHFLDRNRLSHIPIDFVESLVRSGRVVLLLDGYDEMAQYFNSRERRQCLEALASLSSDGAKGLLTSRPNYFTLSEELHVFEALYSSLKVTHFINDSTRVFLDQEEQIDRLLEKFLDRHERTLRDLTPEQTNALISRILHGDPNGLAVIQHILAKIFRNQDGSAISLSGKPVIVSYLLDVVEQLKGSRLGDEASTDELSEWQVYKLIVDQLMLRDLVRSPDVSPDARRRFLQKLAIFLAKRENEVISEDDFKDLVSSEFKRDINRLTGEARSEALSRFFSNLRSSGTLTRAVTAAGEGWRFSHNSLREFLIAEYLTNQLLSGSIVAEHVTISDAMQTFAASITPTIVSRLYSGLQVAWRNPGADGIARGQLLSLLWGALLTVPLHDADRAKALLNKFSGIGDGLRGISISRVNLSNHGEGSNLSGINFSGALFASVNLGSGNFTGCNFADAVFDDVDATDANFSGGNFDRSLLVDFNLCGANLSDTSFMGVASDDTVLIVDSQEWPHSRRLAGDYAIGFLKYKGARTNPVSDYFVYANHPRFSIIEKIVINLSKQAQRQRRGLEQRGAAHADVVFARAFVSHLINVYLVITPKNRKEILEPTERGRQVFQEFVGNCTLAPELISFLQTH